MSNETTFQAMCERLSTYRTKQHAAKWPTATDIIPGMGKFFIEENRKNNYPVTMAAYDRAIDSDDYGITLEYLQTEEVKKLPLEERAIMLYIALLYNTKYLNAIRTRGADQDGTYAPKFLNELESDALAEEQIAQAIAGRFLKPRFTDR